MLARREFQVLIAAGVFCCFIAFSPAAKVSLDAVTGMPGQTVTTNFRYVSEGAQVAVLQFDLEYPSSLVGLPGATVGPAVPPGRIFGTFDPASNVRRFRIDGPFPPVALGDGIVIVLFMAIKPVAPLGIYPLKFVGVLAEDINGNPVSVTTTDGSFTVVKKTVVLEGTGATPIPTLSEWGVILLAALLAAVGGWLLARRRLKFLAALAKDSRSDDIPAPGYFWYGRLPCRTGLGGVEPGPLAGASNRRTEFIPLSCHRLGCAILHLQSPVSAGRHGFFEDERW